MDEQREELDLIELGEVSEETKGFGTGARDNPETASPNKKVIA